MPNRFSGIDSNAVQLLNVPWNARGALVVKPSNNAGIDVNLSHPVNVYANI